MRRRTCFALLALLLLALGAGLLRPPAGVSAQESASPPVFAYYYIWFTESSWDRAKKDYPLLGRYSSDDPAVMRKHIELAKQAGIDGFIVSWKGKRHLNARLRKLMRIAAEKRFKLMVIYQGLDFFRNPLPIKEVVSDLRRFEADFAPGRVFDYFGTPTVIWSGTWKYSRAEIRTGTAAVPGLRILASEKNVAGYERVARFVEGDAYYWSSVNPETYPGYPEKLQAMSAAVHDDAGLWIAPAAPGFDARMIGGTTLVRRLGGKTLRREYAAAVSSSPDAVGLISWNEFTENSHVEPSERYGTQSLDVLSELLGTAPPP